MKLNVFCESRSSHTEDQMTSSGTTEWRSLNHQKGGTASPVNHPTPLNPRPPNAPTASSIRMPEIEEVMPWGVFAAYGVTLASTGFLFVMALTGGLNLG